MGAWTWYPKSWMVGFLIIMFATFVRKHFLELSQLAMRSGLLSTMFAVHVLDPGTTRLSTLQHHKPQVKIKKKK